MDPSCGFMVFVIWVWWLPLMQGEVCPSTRCGDVVISDPFWISDKAESSCGPLDFQVTCVNRSTPFLRSSIPYGIAFDFRILKIVYEERSMHVVDHGKLELLMDFKRCQVPTWNTSAKLANPFKVGPRAEPVDVGEVGEDPNLRGQPEPPRNASRCVSGLGGGQQTVRLPSAEERSGRTVDAAEVLTAGEGGGAHNALNLNQVSLGSSGEAGLQREPGRDDLLDRSVRPSNMREDGGVPLGKWLPRKPLIEPEGSGGTTHNRGAGDCTVKWQAFRHDPVEVGG
jgi:hypothetical protein